MMCSLYFANSEEVFVYKTVERKCKVAKAAYLDPNDDEDASSNDNQKRMAHSGGQNRETLT